MICKGENRMNKVALITGGTGGIGSALVRGFLDAGYKVIFTYNNNTQKAQELIAQFGGSSSDLLSVKVDVSSESDVEMLREMIIQRFNYLDTIIYATGIFEDALIESMEVSSWNRVIDADLTGAFLIAKHLLGMLKVSERGRFITIGSVMGESGIYGSCSYAAAKAGLIGLTKSIALETAKYGVTANVVSLGYISTGMTMDVSDKVLESAIKRIPMKKLGNPEDVAKTIVDLCKESTNYISGQVIRINGLLYV